MHDAFFCQQPCPRVRKTCDHACQNLCGEKCGPCMAKVNDVKLPCGHDKTLRCHQKNNLKSIQCMELVEKRVPGCGHTVTVECYLGVDSEGFNCHAPCTHLLSCGHQCPGSCSECNKNGTVQHFVCTKTCDRPFGSCNHRCSRGCHDGESCGSCKEQCEV